MVDTELIAGASQFRLPEGISRSHHLLGMPVPAPTGYPDQLPNAGFVVTKLLLQAHHGGKAMHPSPGNLASLNSSPKAQE